MGILLIASCLRARQRQITVNVQSLIAQKCLLSFFLGFVILKIFSSILWEEAAGAPLLGGGIGASCIVPTCSASRARSLKPLLDLLSTECCDIQSQEKIWVLLHVVVHL